VPRGGVKKNRSSTGRALCRQVLTLSYEVASKGKTYRSRTAGATSFGFFFFFFIMPQGGVRIESDNKTIYVDFVVKRK